MDRQSIIGFVLIAALFVGWMAYNAMNAPDAAELARQEAAQRETQQHEPGGDTQQEGQTTTQGEAALTDGARGDGAQLTASDPVSRDSQLYGEWFAGHTGGDVRTFTVKTTKFDAVFSSKGGTLVRWTLNDFFTWNNAPLQLINWNAKSDYNLVFGTSDGRLIDTRDMRFVFSSIPEDGIIELEDSARYSFEAVLPVRGDSIAIVRRFTIVGGGYNVDMDVEMRNMKDVISNFEYQVTIESPNLTERNTVDEANFSEAMAFVGNEVIGIDSPSETADEDENRLNRDGKTAFIAIHNKYFLSALVGRDGFEGNGAYMEGISRKLPDEGQKEVYQASMKVRYRGEPVETSHFRIFIGPMEYDLLSEQHEGLQNALNLGWEFVVRPFTEYLIIPLFSFLHMFIPNYGFVIIVFSIIIKLLLYPLTRSSMRSMQRMQKLQPMMTELKEKYKDDQQKQNMETMKLYKEYGINPAGGCLPLLLQMPILYALFTLFQSTIELRQQPFVGWITDLAAPDILISLPFKLPVVGMTFISGLALMMAITMFVQQKMSVKDPRQKAMVWMMPIMFWFLFNGFPSGLNLYYFMFNLLSIGQQYLINKRHDDEPLEKVKKKNGKKQGWSERMMANMNQKVQEQKKMSAKGRK